MASFLLPREPSVEGAPGPSRAETGWRAGLGLGLGSLIDRVKGTVLPAAGDRSADEAAQQSRIARLLRRPLPPVKTETAKEVGAETKSGAAGVSANGRDPPPPKSSFKSYRRARRARRSLAAAGGDDAATKTSSREHMMHEKYAPTTCFGLLNRTNPLRALCIRVSESSHFDTFILLTILANAVVLCMMEPSKLEGRGCASVATSTRGAGNAAIENSELVFTTVFTIEMLIKMLASGVYFENGAYLKDGWNVMDFVVVVVSLVSLLPGVGNNASALRVVRVLRPLRTLSVLPGMRTLIGTVIRAIPMIGNVMLFCVFFFTVFGILGLQLFMGAFRNKCFTASSAVGCDAHVANDDVVACVDAATLSLVDTTIGSYVLLAEDTEQYCAQWEAAHWPGYACPEHQRCLKHRNPHGGLIHFDDVAHAWLTIFQCITLEGWTPIMYAAMDAITGWSVLYFVLLVFTGGFFLLNLALAVITEVYDEESAEAQMAADDAEEAAEKSGAEKEAETRAAKRAALVEYLNGKDGGKTSRGGDSDGDEGDDEGGTLREGRTDSSKSSAGSHTTGRDGMTFLRSMATARVDSVKPVVEHRLFGAFFTACILLNTLVLAMEFDGMSSAYESGLSAVNVALTVAFAAELLVKLLGLGITEYFRDAFNTFDALVVLISLVELLLADSGSLSALRSFRILRILKLIRSWRTLQKFLYTMYATVASLGEFAFVVVLAVFIFALLGMQMFGGKMCAESDTFAGDPTIPRHNFDTLLWALVTVFQVLTGEDWNAVMYDATLASGSWSSLYFVALLVIGNFLVLNLFIAILLNNFSAQEVADELQDAKKLLESISFFNTYVAKERGVDESAREIAARRRREALVDALPEKKMRFDVAKKWATFGEKVYDLVLASEEAKRREEAAILEQEEAERQARVDQARAARKKYEGVGFFGSVALFVSSFATPRPGAAPKPLRRYVGNAFGLRFLNPRTSVVRKTCYAIVDDKRFDAFIMVCIAASSVLMAFESPKAMLDDAFAGALEVADWCFTVLFTLEMLMKLTAFGVWLEEPEGTYLRDAWNVMDGSIVLVGILGKALSGTNISWVRALRTMRVLRPLRVISRVPELRVVVNALLRSLPGLGNVLLVALLFWLIFGILGMQLFMGAFSRCSDESVDTKALCVDGWVNQTLDVAWDSVSQSCAGWSLMLASAQGGELPLSSPTSEATCVGSYESSAFVERTWASDHYNFDNIFNAMRTLFEMSTTEGWTAVMYDGVDSRSPELAPERDHNPAIAFFFIVFMILANFFILNLFVGIILDNFAQIAEESGDGGSATMTKEQQLWAQRKRNFFDVGEDYGKEDASLMAGASDDDDDEGGEGVSGRNAPSTVKSNGASGKKAPHLTIAESPPASPRAARKKLRRGVRRARRFLFRVSHSASFEAGIMGVIVVNAGAMACEHYGQTQVWTDTLSGISYACTAVFIAEALIKLFAMGRKYFKSRWNAFDFFCVATSVLGLAADVGSTTSVLRVLRLARVFRLVRKLKGLRMLFNTLVISLPGLVNIGALLFLLCFVFAVLGMNLFGKVTFGENLNEHANFTNFGNSLLILLRMVTGEAWNSIMYDAMVTEEESDCDPSQDCAPGTCCGVAGAPAYFIAFVVLGSFVTLNLLIAVVVDNFSNNAKDVEGEDVGEADVRAFERGWCRIDKNRTGYIPRMDLASLIRKVPPPLGMRGVTATRLASVRFQKNLDIDEFAPKDFSEWVHFEDALMSFMRHAMGIRTNTLPEDMRQEVRAELAKRAAASFARVKAAEEAMEMDEAGDSSSGESEGGESAATTPAGSPRHSASFAGARDAR